MNSDRTYNNRPPIRHRWKPKEEAWLKYADTIRTAIEQGLNSISTTKHQALCDSIRTIKRTSLESEIYEALRKFRTLYIIYYIQCDE